MRNIWALFKGDVKRLGRNVVTVIALVGLVALPSIFSWYNIIACWDVFENTGNLTVAVANSDEGYESDLVPLRTNVGDQVISALRANDQLNWVFTDEDDAIDGARSGRYYAAVVIPETFSRDMMSFFSDDVEHAKITYYSNQKKNAISPKVTDQGADQISNQINEVFAQTISEVAIGISTTLADYAEQSDASGRIGDLAAHMQNAGDQVDDAAAALSSYSAVLGSTRQLVESSVNLGRQAGASADEVAASARQAKQAAESSAAALSDASSKLKAALGQASGDYRQVASAVDEALTASAQATSEAIALLKEQAQTAEALGQHDLAQRINEAVAEIEEAGKSADAARTEAKQHADAAAKSMEDAKGEYESDVKPALDGLAAAAESASRTVSETSELLGSTGTELYGSADSVCGKLEAAQGKIDGAAANLGDAASKLKGLGASVEDALESNELGALSSALGSDPQALAATIAAPVELERNAVYPAQNFGSAMAPLYTTLALWIGALLIMVTLKVVPGQRVIEELDDPTPRQTFIGRFGIVGLISLMQSTLLASGNLLFLGVQAAHPWLYLLCFWVSGLLFAFIIYTLVALFANLGKALSVILLIVQVSGGGGSFPLQLLPPFFQTLSPYLPISHAVRAMRAAMFGIYQNDFWMELGTLALFAVPFVLLAILLHYPLSKIVPRFIERVEQSKLM